MAEGSGSGWMCTRARRLRACSMRRRASCGVCGRRRCRPRWSSGCVGFRRRCGSPTRRGRPATGSRARARRRGSRVRSRRRRRSSGRRPTGSRPIAATPSGWRACCGWASWWRCACPPPYEEAARDLVRAREDARGELMRARHRLSKLLLRHGLVYDAAAWTLAHDAWLRRQRFESRPLQFALEESYAAAAQAKARRDALDRAIAELAAEPPFAEIVGRLCCLRGVGTLTALALTVELGDWSRFRPQALGPFRGRDRLLPFDGLEGAEAGRDLTAAETSTGAGQPLRVALPRRPVAHGHQRVRALRAARPPRHRRPLKP